MSEKPEKLVDYTIYDDKFRAYRVKVPEHKVSLYNMDHLATYRLLNQIKRGKIPSVSSSAITDDDLRSPVKKKSKARRAVVTAATAKPPFEMPRSVDLANESEDVFPLPDDDEVPEEPLESNAEANDELNYSFGKINVGEDGLGNLNGDWAHLQESKFDDVTTSESFALLQPQKPATSTPCKNGEVIMLTRPSPELIGNNVVAVGAETYAKYSSSWTNEEAVHALLNLIGRNLPRLSRGRNHNQIWEDITGDLLKLGFKFTALECRNKKRSLESHYYKVMKAENPDKSTWPFYRALKFIVTDKSWPADFISGRASQESSIITNELEEHMSSGNDFSNTEQISHHGLETSFVQESSFDPAITAANNNNNLVIQENVREGRKKETGWNWTDSDLILVQQYYEVKATKPDVLRNDMIFFYVASELQKSDIFMSMNDVKSKFYALQSMFRKKVDSQKQTGTGGFSDPLYDLFLMYLEEDHPSINAAVTVSLGSVGSRTKVTRFDASQGNASVSSSSRCTKKRPPSSNRQERAARLMGPSHSRGAIGYQNRALDIQQQKLALEAQFVSDFSLMRHDMKEREKSIQASIQLLKDIRDGNKSLSPQDK